MISHDDKCIFVHVPKSGGSSIESLIWPGERREVDLWMGFVSKYRNKYQTGGLQHLLATQIRDHVGEDVFNQYFKFSFVRNPWDKAVSQFSYMSDRSDLMQYIGMKEGCSFKKYLELMQKKTHVQWEKQYKFIYDENLESLVNYLGRFENIESDTKEIFSRLGLEFNCVPHTNKSFRKKFSLYWDDESIEMVGDIYKEDIDIFDYSFPINMRANYSTMPTTT